MKTQKNAKNSHNKRLFVVKKHHTKRFISTFFTTALLTACTAAPIGQIENDLAQIPIPAQWMHAHHDAQSQAADHWWHNFQDPDLNRLIDQALNHNHNLAAALTAWRQSLLAVDSSLARQTPQYSGDLAARASRDLDNRQNSHNVSASLAASYQLDLWQKLDAQNHSAAANADASGEDYLAARLSLAGQVAKAYYQLRYLDDQITWNQRFAANARERLARTRSKHDAGSVSRLELVQESQTLTSLERDAQNLAAQRAQAQNSLAVLLGIPPQTLTLSRKTLDDTPIPAIPAGLPAHLLAQRPDLRAAQYRLQAALADIAVAERDFYPDISLTANLGSSSQTLIRLLQNPIASLGASLSLPFLQQRDKEIALLGNQLAYRKNLQTFTQTLYQALTDVENTLIRRDSLGKEAAILEEQLAQARDIENLTQIRYEAGAVSLQDALDAKNSREQTQSAQLTNRYNQLDAAIDLYLALGGNTRLNTSQPTAKP